MSKGRANLPFLLVALNMCAEFAALNLCSECSLNGGSILRANHVIERLGEAYLPPAGSVSSVHRKRYQGPSVMITNDLFYERGGRGRRALGTAGKMPALRSAG